MSKEKYRTISDKRMMEVLTWYRKEMSITQGEACEIFGINQQALSLIRAGRQSFVKDHLEAMVKKIKNLNLNYIFGTENNMFRRGDGVSALQALRQAVKMIEKEISSRK